MEISFISIRDLQTKLRDGRQFTQYADLQSPKSLGGSLESMQS